MRAPETHRAIHVPSLGGGAREEPVRLVQVSESATRWRLFHAIVNLHAGQQAKPSAGVADDGLGRGRVTFHTGQVNAAESAPGYDALKAEAAPHRMESEAESRWRKF